MSKDEALKLARELDNVIEDVEQGNGFDNVCLGTIKYVRDALADSALDRMAENARELGLDYEPACKTGSQCTSKCQQCEQPAPVATPHKQQEPVAWMWRCKPYCGWPEWSVSLKRPADSGRDGHKRTEGYEDLPLYTSPQRKPLTDEQIIEMYNEPRSDAEMLEFARAIEAAHGIKGSA